MKTKNFATKSDILQRMKELKLGPEYRFKGSMSHEKKAIFYKVLEPSQPSELPEIFLLREYPSNFEAYKDMNSKGWHPDPKKHEGFLPSLEFFELEETGSALPNLHKSVCGYLEAATEVGRLYLPPGIFKKLKALRNELINF